MQRRVVWICGMLSYRSVLLNIDTTICNFSSGMVVGCQSHSEFTILN